jgi:HK97 gp10 family phage protein
VGDAKFTPNEAGIQQMLRAPFMVDDMRRRGENVKARVEATAPVDTGYHRDHIRLTYGVRAGMAFAQVTATARYAFWLEFGTKFMKAFKTLRRALSVAKR